MVPHPLTTAAWLALVLGQASAQPVDAAAAATAVVAASAPAVGSTRAAAAASTAASTPAAAPTSAAKAAATAPCLRPRLAYGTGFERRHLHGPAASPARPCAGPVEPPEPEPLRALGGNPAGRR
jgi:hypothetical protein